jgi:hypothetical protein
MVDKRHYTGLTLPTNARPGLSGELFFHGDLDDHLRAITLIAHSAKAKAPEQANECLRDDLTWSDRLDAFRALTARLKSARLHLGVLVNFHLLVSNSSGSEAERWDDALFTKQRNQLGALLDAQIADDLASTLDTTRANQEAPINLPDSIARCLRERAISPAVVKLAEGLYTLGWRDEYLLNLIIESAGDNILLLETAIFHAAFSVLGPAPLRALKRLAALRAPLPLNGTLGPLTLDGADADIPRDHLNLLVDLGWLHKRGEPLFGAYPLFWMEPLARQYVRSMTNRPEGRQLQELSNDTAHKLADNKSLDPHVARAEAHYIAIKTQDIDLALGTADHYGADLRSMGRELSAQAKGTSKEEQRRLYFDAASVYRWIVERFDDEDSYAWEYLAYNREAAQNRVDEVVLGAYRRADELEGGENPLYRGRLVAALLRSEGSGVLTLTRRELERLLTALDEEALRRAAWFIDPVLIALQKMKAHRDHQSLLNDYGPVLERSQHARRHLQRWLPQQDTHP